jgi:hypothetical protein
MYKLGKEVFISYRSDYYKDALALKQHLEKSSYCREAILYPPNSLTASDEILLPYDYFKLMEVILDRLAPSQAFLYLNTPDYWDSYFTQAEVLQWRRFRRDPEAIPITVISGNDFQICEKQNWESIPSSDKDLWSKVSVNINPKMKSTFPVNWGKYSKSCFLLPCRQCGEHFLASSGLIYAALKEKAHVACPHPHCSNNQFRFRQENAKGKFDRNPIILNQTRKVKLRVLDSFELLQLLFDKRLPSKIPLVSLEGENIRSEFFKNALKSMGIAAALVGLAYIPSLFSKKDD